MNKAFEVVPHAPGPGEESSRPRVEVRGAALYALWAPGSVPHIEAAVLPEIWGEHTQIDLWPVTHLTWRPAREGMEAPWLTMEQLVAGLGALRKRMLELGSARTDARGVAPLAATPVYLIVHIEALRTHVPRVIQQRIQRMQRRARRRGEVVDTSEGPATWAQEAVLHQLLEEFGVAEVDPLSGWAPGYFDHFDRLAHQRGWIVVAPILALVAGASAEEVRTLASLIQPRDADTSGLRGGLLPNRYEGVLGRVAQWNGTQDVFEAVSQLKALIESGEKSTNGQVWLNFALAAIGVLLAIFSGPRLGYGQIVPLLLLAVASMLHAQYARSGASAYQWAAWALWATAIIVSAVLLAPMLGLHL